LSPGLAFVSEGWAVSYCSRISIRDVRLVSVSSPGASRSCPGAGGAGGEEDDLAEILEGKVREWNGGASRGMPVRYDGSSGESEVGI